MSTLTVLTWPDPHLRQTAVPVEKFDDSIRTLVANMFETMYAEEGVGLAATQVGEALRIVVIDCGLDEPHPLALVNATITEREGTIIWMEGCLSIPGVKAEVERSERIVIEYSDSSGRPQSLEATGLLSVCIQHELDHLGGQMYFDRLGEMERRATLNAYDDARSLDQQVVS